MDDMLRRLRLCRLSCRGEEKKDKGSQDWGSPPTGRSERDAAARRRPSLVATHKDEKARVVVGDFAKLNSTSSTLHVHVHVRS
jgi:hypothetical protein